MHRAIDRVEIYESVKDSRPAARASPRQLSFVENVVAGAAAGGTELLAMYPLDTVKTRQQLVSAGTIAKGESASIIGSLRTIVQKEGATALYRGILSPLAVEPFKRAVKFTANAKYNSLIVGKGEKTISTATLCGSLAGMSEVRNAANLCHTHQAFARTVRCLHTHGAARYQYHTSTANH